MWNKSRSKNTFCFSVPGTHGFAGFCSSPALTQPIPLFLHPPVPGYVDVGVIPEGARDIVVQEVEEAGNFLALRGQMSEEYFLNGQYIIQWNGEYKAGGATFYYERSGNLENLTSSGPTKQPVMIQVHTPFKLYTPNNQSKSNYTHHLNYTLKIT